MSIFSLIDLYQLRKSLSNCAIPLSDADFGTFASRLGTLMASLENQQSQQQQDLISSDEDTPQRRSLLAILWRFVQLDWIQHQFKCIEHPLIPQIAHFIFLAMQNATFTNDRIWFGGVSRIKTFTSTDLAADARPKSSPSMESRVQLRQNSVLFFALGLTLIGFHADIGEIVPADAIRHFMTKFDQMFIGSPNIFMDALLENDERCLQTMAALQRMHAMKSKNAMALLKVPTMTSPDILALSMLSKIHFDPLVVIDWVSSEPELCFVFLKQFSHRLGQLSHDELAQLCAAFVKMPNTENAVNECRFQIVYHQPADAPDNDNYLHFKIEEIHGQHSVPRNVVVPTKMTTTCAVQQMQKGHGTKWVPPECSTDEMCQKVVAFCAELRQKLRTLAKHLHFPEKSICANLQMFLDNVQPSSA